MRKRILKTILLIALSATLFACGGGSPVISAAPAVVAKTIVIDAIGDSITEGWQTINGVSGAHPEFSYPTVLAKLTGYKVNNYGVGGKTSTDIYTMQFDKALADKPDIIIVDDGINDILKGISPEEYRNNNTLMAQRAHDAGIKFYFLSAIPWGTIPDQVAQYNAIMKEVALQTGSVYLDVSTIYKPSWVCNASDGHPCTDGYAEIAQLVASSIPAVI